MTGKCTTLAAGLMLLLAATGFAQDAAAPAENAEKNEPPQIAFYLMDGSQVTGTLKVDAIQINTSYGPLSVPVDQIVRIRPGLDSLSKLDTQIAEWIDQLGSMENELRDKAQRSLTNMGLSIRGELVRHREDDDPERKLRIEAILTEFDQMADDLAMNDDEFGDNDVEPLIRKDTVATDEFTIVGNITNREFAIVNTYGTLNVKLADIRKAQRITENTRETVRKTVTVNQQNFVQSGYRMTGIRVQRGDKITIRAEGQLVMSPWGSNAISTPDGAPNYNWYIQGQIPGGCLVGRIGSGNIVKLGSKANFVADRNGELGLAIGMDSRYTGGNQFPGEYKVRIQVDPVSE